VKTQEKNRRFYFIRNSIINSDLIKRIFFKRDRDYVKKHLVQNINIKQKDRIG